MHTYLLFVHICACFLTQVACGQDVGALLKNKFSGLGKTYNVGKAVQADGVTHIC